jgi:NhaP-type Na+/H+ and K+/H+ antiporter
MTIRCALSRRSSARSAAKAASVDVTSKNGEAHTDPLVVDCALLVAHATAKLRGPDWLGRSVRALEEATGARIAYIMRFGVGTLPTPSGALQDGDQVYMLVTDDMMSTVTKITSAAPEERAG